MPPLPATGTVFSDDIVNGEVKTKDISDTNGVRSADVRDDDLNGGGLAAVDLARESVARAEIAMGGVGVNEIATNAVRACIALREPRCAGAGVFTTATRRGDCRDLSLLSRRCNANPSGGSPAW